MVTQNENTEEIQDSVNEIDPGDELTDETPVLKSSKYNLAGRPDYIINEGDQRIPVEVKTGR